MADHTLALVQTACCSKEWKHDSVNWFPLLWPEGWDQTTNAVLYPNVQTHYGTEPLYIEPYSYSTAPDNIMFYKQMLCFLAHADKALQLSC